MNKFYSKKSISLEETPILLPLERRHTIEKELADDEIKTTRPASKRNSMGSYSYMESRKSQSSASTLPPQEECSDERSSNASNASTLVITESDLSSSWLYKQRKARMNSSLSNSDLLLEEVKDDEELKPVVLHDPRLIPVPVPTKSNSEDLTSRCCCALVAIIITFCALGILSAIGGIIYMEVFATYKKINSELSTVATINSVTEEQVYNLSEVKGLDEYTIMVEADGVIENEPKDRSTMKVRGGRVLDDADSISDNLMHFKLDEADVADALETKNHEDNKYLMAGAESNVEDGNQQQTEFPTFVLDEDAETEENRMEHFKLATENNHSDSNTSMISDEVLNSNILSTATIPSYHQSSEDIESNIMMNRPVSETKIALFPIGEFFKLSQVKPVINNGKLFSQSFEKVNNFRSVDFGEEVYSPRSITEDKYESPIVRQNSDFQEQKGTEQLKFISQQSYLRMLREKFYE